MSTHTTKKLPELQETAPKRPPFRIAVTILHLAAMGSIGLAVIGGLFALIVSGITTVVFLGLGFVLLIGALYVMWAIAWFENERVSGLYRLGSEPLRLPQSQHPGFKGWLHSLLLILKNGRMWIAVVSFTLSVFIGFVMLLAIQFTVSYAAGTLFQLFVGRVLDSPMVVPFLNSDAQAALVLALSIVLFVVVLFAAALLHRAITSTMIGAMTRESELTERVRKSEMQRRGAVRSAEMDRTRIERDLHDGVQPRLVSIGMTLGLAKQQIHTDPNAAEALIEEAHTSTQAAITELRQLARGIYASVLDDRGLDAALSAIVARSHIPVNLDVRLTQECGKQAETALYFGIAEALTNVAKHSRAANARVTVRVRDTGTPEHPDGRLWARVEDDGVGGATLQPGSGLDGIAHRMQAAGGSFSFDSPVGGPTTIEMSVPCES